MLTNSFEIISGLASIGYIFIFMIFMNAEKNNLITSFLTLVLAMVFWTGGSLLMRLQFFPNYVFWYHISIAGLLLMVYGYYNFVSTFLSKKDYKFSLYSKIGLVIVFLINLPTGLILKWPSLEVNNKTTLFVYDDITLYVLLFFLPVLPILLNTIYLMYKDMQTNKKGRTKVYPLILGVLILLIGNIFVLTPIFRGFPIDILSGVLNILCFMYVLIQKRLLKPKMITSNNIAYLFSTVLGFSIFYVSYPFVSNLLSTNHINNENYTWFYLLYYALVSAIFYLLWYFVVNKIALKDEEYQDALLKEYSSNISKSLDIDSVVNHTINTIRYATGTTNIYVGILEHGTGNCLISYSDKSMNGLSYALSGGSSFLSWLHNTDDLESLREFYLSNEYKRLNDEDKEKLDKLGVTHVMGLKDTNELKGVIFITDNNPKKKLLGKDINLISSISTIASVALSEEQFRPLVTEMHLGLSLNEIICNEQGEPIDSRFISVNNSYERLMGINKEHVVGKSILTVFPNTDIAWIQTCGLVALSGESKQLNVYQKDMDKHFSTTIYSPKRNQFAVIIDDITAQKKAEQQIEYMSYHDTLTNLYNRRYFDIEVERLDQKRNLPISIIMADVNKLKYVNDTFGHDAGDELIRKAAEVLKHSCRSDEIVARLGGDEFIILLPNVDSNAAEIIINRLENNLKGISVHGVPLTISFGYATKLSSEEDMKEVIKSADGNMYKNKVESKKNNVIDSNYIDDRL